MKKKSKSQMWVKTGEVLPIAGAYKVRLKNNVETTARYDGKDWTNLEGVQVEVIAWFYDPYNYRKD